MANKTMHHLVIGDNNYEILDAKNRANIAAEYSTSSTYNVGDVVLYNGQLYKCTTAITTAEAWTAAHWTAVTVGGKIADLEATTNDLKDDSSLVLKRINLIDESELIDNKYYDPNTGAFLTGNNTTKATPLIPLDTGNYYFYTNFTGSQFMSAVVFNSDKSYSRFISTADIRFSSPVVSITGDESYIGISLYNTQLGGNTAFIPEEYSEYYVGLQNSANIIPAPYATKSINFNQIITVDQRGLGDFVTINDAVASITDDSALKPYTIMVYPGIYKEVVAIQGNRHISLIGVNRHDCIIRDDTGLYANCPLQIGGDCTVENLTIITTHNGNPDLPTTGNKAYAIHADYAGAGILTIRNCKLISYQSSAIGAGLYQDQTIFIENCELISHTPASYGTTPSYGAFFVHANTDSNVTGQVLVVKDCIINSDTAFACAFSNSPDGTSDMEINLYNNMFWSEINGKADSVIKEWYTPVYSDRCYGNNVAKLNA